MVKDRPVVVTRVQEESKRSLGGVQGREQTSDLVSRSSASEDSNEAGSVYSLLCLCMCMWMCMWMCMYSLAED